MVAAVDGVGLGKKKSFPALEVFKCRETDGVEGWAGLSGYHRDGEDRVSGGLLSRKAREGGA